MKFLPALIRKTKFQTFLCQFANKVVNNEILLMGSKKNFFIACLPSRYGPGCENECEPDWILCDEKYCYLCDLNGKFCLYCIDKILIYF